MSPTFLTRIEVYERGLPFLRQRTAATRPPRVVSGLFRRMKAADGRQSSWTASVGAGEDPVLHLGHTLLGCSSPSSPGRLLSAPTLGARRRQPSSPAGPSSAPQQPPLPLLLLAVLRCFLSFLSLCLPYHHHLFLLLQQQKLSSITFYILLLLPALLCSSSPSCFVMLSIWKATVFEGLGSMCLVWLVGASSTALGAGDSILTGLALGILYTLGTSLSMYTLGPVSGGHINPFITLATMAAGTLSLVRGAAYVIAHLIGAMAGGALVAAALGPAARNTSNGGCILRSLDAFSLKQAFALEFMAAFFLILLLHGTGLAHQQINNHGNRLAPLLFGLSVGLITFATSGFANTHAYIGSSGYPNICFGLAAGIMQFQSSHWVFWIPGFVAVVGFGLATRLMKPYDLAEQVLDDDMSIIHTMRYRDQNIVATVETEVKSSNASQV
ncbi:hypothetical protein VP01_711g5 [Puccinia sorghi]|uniref:Aquaporin n=1 Tax=Puccinia sorghi TaxID=27349 RepID=A0A0L6UDG8_9BASI|nr:hypothetical protein VP01_711g5 [Puccinia sorghi]